MEFTRTDINCALRSNTTSMLPFLHRRNRSAKLSRTEKAKRSLDLTLPVIKSAKKVDFDNSEREEIESENDFKGYTNLKPYKPAFDYDFGNYVSGLESNNVKGMAIPIFKRIVITPKTAATNVEEEKAEEVEVLTEHEIYRNKVFDEHERSYRSASITSDRASRSIRSMRQTITSIKDMKNEFDGAIEKIDKVCNEKYEEVTKENKMKTFFYDKNSDKVVEFPRNARHTNIRADERTNTSGSSQRQRRTVSVARPNIKVGSL